MRKRKFDRSERLQKQVVEALKKEIQRKLYASVMKKLDEQEYNLFMYGIPAEIKVKGILEYGHNTPL